MNKLFTAAAVALLISGAFSNGRAFGQYYPSFNRGVTNPYQRPPLSPYFSLAGATPSRNYFFLTQPQQQFITDQNKTNQQVLANQQSLLGLQSAEQITSSGYPTRFMNYQRYFLNLNATASGAITAQGTAAFGSRIGQGLSNPSGSRTPARGR